MGPSSASAAVTTCTDERDDKSKSVHKQTNHEEQREPVNILKVVEGEKGKVPAAVDEKRKVDRWL